MASYVPVCIRVLSGENDINRIMIIKQKGGALPSTCIREIFKHIMDDVLGYHYTIHL